MTRSMVVFIAALGVMAAVANVAAAQSCDPPSSSSSSTPSSSSDVGDDATSSNAGGGGYSSGDYSGDDYDYDSGDDYDSGSSSSGGGGSSRAVGCQDRTDITGLEECSRFGRGWNAVWPSIRFELGPSVRRLSLEGITFGGVTYHEENPHHFTLNANDLADPTVMTGGVNFRIITAIGNHFIIGGELDASFGGSPEGEVRIGDRGLTAGDVWTVGGGLVGGFVIPVGPARFRGEVFAGGQGVGVTAISHLGDCISETSDFQTRWVVEPRVGIEMFVAPWLSVDVWGGADVVNAGSVSGGLRLNLHTRSYDAVR